MHSWQGSSSKSAQVCKVMRAEIPPFCMCMLSIIFLLFFLCIDLLLLIVGKLILQVLMTSNWSYTNVCNCKKTDENRHLKWTEESFYAVVFTKRLTTYILHFPFGFIRNFFSQHGRKEHFRYMYPCLLQWLLCFSNVVEKCVSHSSRAEKAMLIEEVCSMNDG